MHGAEVRAGAKNKADGSCMMIIATEQSSLLKANKWRIINTDIDH
jgi:hypothetical protein